MDLDSATTYTMGGLGVTFSLIDIGNASLLILSLALVIIRLIVEGRKLICKGD